MSPKRPELMDWSSIFPTQSTRMVRALASFSESRTAKPLNSVSIADIGCGFGGLLVALSPVYPQDMILGT